MIIRIWRTGIDERRAHEYAQFALARSLPMFRAQPGFRGLLYARDVGTRRVVTLWDDAAAVAALEQSPSYRQTVDEILSAGFLRPPQTVEVAEVEYGEWPALGTSALP